MVSLASIAAEYAAFSSEEDSDDDDDDVVGGDVPATVNDHNKSTVKSSALKPAVLPLPAAVSDMFEQSNDDVVDTDVHCGKVRTFPHERGNWATYVYLPYIFQPGEEQLIRQFLSQLPCSLHPCEDFHISLSKTVILRYHWISSLIESLKSKLENVKRFIVSLHEMEIYVNEEETRTFLGFKVDYGSSTLMHLLGCVDECLMHFQLPTFYDLKCGYNLFKDPSFHLSIGWTLGNQYEELKKHLPIVKARFEEYFQDTSVFTFMANHIQCKTGNKIFTFNLQ